MGIPRTEVLDDRLSLERTPGGGPEGASQMEERTASPAQMGNLNPKCGEDV